MAGRVWFEAKKEPRIMSAFHFQVVGSTLKHGVQFSVVRPVQGLIECWIYIIRENDIKRHTWVKKTSPSQSPPLKTQPVMYNTVTYRLTTPASH